MNIELILFLITNTIIGIMLLFFLKLNIGSISAKLNATLFSLSVWLIPYHWLKNLIPSDIELNPLGVKSIITNNISAKFNTEITSFNSFITLNNILICLFFIGTIVFIKQFVQYLKWVSNLRKESTFKPICYSTNGKTYTVQPTNHLETALITGFIKPVIWVNKELINTTKFDLIITHEIQHINSYDHWKILFLKLINSFYWWNPIVIFLIKNIHVFIEAHCDFKASKSYGKQSYIDDLAELILNAKHLSTHHFVNSICGNRNTNIARLKMLNQENIMTFKNKFFYLIFLLLSLMLLALPLTSLNANEKIESNIDNNGLLLHFEITKTFPTEKSTTTDKIEFSIWSHFNNPASVKISDKWELGLTISDHEKEVFLDMKIFELDGNHRNLQASPKILATIGVESIIKIEHGETHWEIKVNTNRTQRPSPDK